MVVEARIRRSETAHKAAKKAWQTRRKREKASPTQAALLKAMTEGVRLEQRISLYGQRVYLVGGTGPFRRGKVSFSTFYVLLSRRWIYKASESDAGTTTRHHPDGRIEKFEDKLRVWAISDKGRKVLEKAHADHQ